LRRRAQGDTSYPPSCPLGRPHSVASLGIRYRLASEIRRIDPRARVPCAGIAFEGRPRSITLYKRVEFGLFRWTFRGREASSEDLPGHRGRTQAHCQGEGRPVVDKPTSSGIVEPTFPKSQVRRADRCLRVNRSPNTDLEKQSPAITRRVGEMPRKSHGFKISRRRSVPCSAWVVFYHSSLEA